MRGGSELTLVEDNHAAGLSIGYIGLKSVSQQAKKRSHFNNHLGYHLLEKDFR